MAACEQSAWNNPYPEKDEVESIYYDSFSERPKHLDPASSYSENEAVIIGQIYEPPLQYHFLKRPYELIPLSASELPQPIYLDENNNELPADAENDDVKQTIYRITIKEGILFQPHPAFAKDKNEKYVYHDIKESDLENIDVLSDFKELGTRELIAEDFVYQIKRLVKPGIHSPLAGFMSKYIQGLQELGQELQAENKDEKSFIDLREHPFQGAKVIDRYTYEIRLNQKYPQFIYWLSMYFFSPVAWEVDLFYSQPGMEEKNLSLDWYPVGTGPYMLTTNNPNRHMILERNPNYHGELFPDVGEVNDEEEGFLNKAGQTMPFIDKAYYSLEKEAIPEWNKFLQGYFDTSGIISDSFDQAIQFGDTGDPELTPEMRDKGIKLLTAVQPTTSYMGFNMKDETIGGDSERARLLRRAISIAVDFEELISIFANGRGIPAQGAIPPGIFGYKDGEEGINPYVYDWVNGKPKRKPIEEAKKLLAEAGYPGGRDSETGEPLVLYFDTLAGGAGRKSILNWYRKQFEKLNIQLVIRGTDYNRFQEKIRKGTAQIFGWGWNADYPDPENFMFLLYGPNAKVGHSGENASNYHNEEFDQLFVKMKALPNGPERQAIIDQMIEITRRDAPWLWGFHPKAYSLYHSWYGNAKPNLMARNTLKYKTIDPVLRADKRNEWNKPVVAPIIIVILILIISLLPAVITYKRRQQETV
jgi:peptide/nickel transport system substrate-binding protein